MEKKLTRAEERAIDAWAIYEYREHPKGLYHTCFVDGYKEGYEQAEKDLTFMARVSSGPDGFYYGKGYEQAKKDLGWISVDDRLPEVGHFVLTCVSDTGIPQCVGMALLLEDGTWWDGDIKVRVDYWMEVPKLKEDQK